MQKRMAFQDCIKGSADASDRSATGNTVRFEHGWCDRDDDGKTKDTTRKPDPWFTGIHTGVHEGRHQPNG